MWSGNTGPLALTTPQSLTLYAPVSHSDQLPDFQYVWLYGLILLDLTMYFTETLCL